MAWSSCKSRVLQRCQIQEKNWRPNLRAHMEDGEGLRAELSQTYEAHVQLTGMVILQSIAW
jgi:hypothetical protein